MDHEPPGSWDDAHEEEWEVADLVAEHGSERAALRATWHTLKATLVNFDKPFAQRVEAALFDLSVQQHDGQAR